MQKGKHIKRRILVIGLAAAAFFILLDFVRSQNVVQFAFSHFQACLLEYDLALEEYQENGELEQLEAARRAVEHVEHMDADFLKYHTLSEPLYRKRRDTLTDYLRLLADYSKDLERKANLGWEIQDELRMLYEGNREIEELLVEDSMDYQEIGRKTQGKILDMIKNMTGSIREKLN